MTGKGHKSLVYSCSLKNVNNLKLKLEVTVRDKDGQLLAFADSTQTPIIVVKRNDLSPEDRSGLDSATGLIQRNGKWEMNNG